MQYSICTLVTDFDQYEEMKNSFVSAGFDDDDTEYLIVDNSKENIADAYSGYNQLIEKASGQFLIFCHQDVLLTDHSRIDLDARIMEITKLDSEWAVLSNCGASGILEYALRVTEGDGVVRNTNNFPHLVNSVDEHFFLVKSSAGLKFSSQLSGFHFYGTDICLCAKINNFSSYAIDFHLTHKGTGTVDESFFECKKKLIEHYSSQLPELGWIQTTCARLYISGSSFKNKLYNKGFASYMVKKYNKIKRSLSGAK